MRALKKRVMLESIRLRCIRVPVMVTLYVWKTILTITGHSELEYVYTAWSRSTKLAWSFECHVNPNACVNGLLASTILNVGA